MTYLVITEDGKAFQFNPEDYAFVMHEGDVEAGTYEPKLEVDPIEKGTDKVTYRMTQLMPPLVKVR